MIKSKFTNRANKLIGSILLYILIKGLKKYIKIRKDSNKWGSVDESNKKTLNSALKILEYERSVNNKYQ